jgi:glycosyltransferase involved in cell wall biosynthesis
MISTIVPSYKNPKCLEICIRSFIDTLYYSSNELICVIDGHIQLYESLINKYQPHNNIHFILNENNQGMPFSINNGVYYASSQWILIINDDNVFPMSWDSTLYKYRSSDLVISPNQIEKHPSIFNFIQHDFGDVNNFRYDEFLKAEPSFRQSGLSNDGEIFPFFMSKKLFMAVGGFDLIYPSPFVCDWDFFLKLELLNTKFSRTRDINFYHFGSVATKKSKDRTDADKFSNSEIIASQVFYKKWGFQPHISRPSNSHKPAHINALKGIVFYDT